MGEHGFSSSQALPLIHFNSPLTLRKKKDIQKRLLSLYLLFGYVTRPSLSGEFLWNYNLHGELTESERSILDLSLEEKENCVNAIGWKLENMWTLAWAVGFKHTPHFYLGMIKDEMVRELLEFCQSVLGEMALGDGKRRSLMEIYNMADIYYCAHNAVRSAQLGKKTVPEDFHPLRDGGAIHERRHSLDCILSPNTP